MNKARFVINRLRHDRAAHAALAAGSALATAVLTGSLLAGASTRESLQRHVRERIGAIELTVSRGRIVIQPVEKIEYDLDALVRGIKPGNAHGEVSFGEPVGKESL